MGAPPSLPYIDVTTGAVTGSLTKGGSFSWYNPTNMVALITNVGNFCVVDSYQVPAGGSTPANFLGEPNQQGLAFTSTVSNIGGMPHVQGPINMFVPGDDEKVA